MTKTKESKTVQTEERTVSKDIGIKPYIRPEVRESYDDGTPIACPILANVHVMVETAWGDMRLTGFTVRKGKDGKPFVGFPATFKKLFDQNGRQAGTRVYHNVGMLDRKEDMAFQEAVKNRILSCYKDSKREG